MNIFEEVKSRVSTLEAAKTYGLNLKKKGTYYISLCPWHKEKTGSFTIYPTGGFKCYGCGAGGGDSIKLTQKLFDLSPIEAARKLAEDFHILIVEPKFDKSQRKQIAHEIDTLNKTADYLSLKIESIYDNLCKFFKLFRELEDDFKDFDKADITYQWFRFQLDFFDKYSEKFAMVEIGKQLYYTQNICEIYEDEYREWSRWIRQLN
jgi:hypothetical protein